MHGVQCLMWENILWGVGCIAVELNCSGIYLTIFRKIFCMGSITYDQIHVNLVERLRGYKVHMNCEMNGVGLNIECDHGGTIKGCSKKWTIIVGNIVFEQLLARIWSGIYFHVLIAANQNPSAWGS